MLDIAAPCVLWDKAKDKWGYGKQWHLGKVRLAHRVAYAAEHNISIEEVPALLRHACDNPACVNPKHLEPGTQKDNVADMVARKRDGNRQRREFSSEDIRAIRASSKSQRVLAAEYGVARNTIKQIINHESYKDIA